MENKEIKPKNEIVKPKVSMGGKIFIYILFILIIPIFWYIGKQNAFKRSKQNIEETASGIEVQLKKRYDLLTKLIETTKQYMKFEKNILEDITSLRTGNTNGNIREMNETNLKMDRISRAINVQLENYPDLKSAQTVVNLQLATRDCEEDIAASRRFYNTSVRNYNQSILTYPGNVVADKLNLQTEIFFEATPAERQDVKIDLY